MRKKISKTTAILLIISALALIPSFWLPIWKIDLEAPQYPEGLSMQIWIDTITGDVDKINGLNHYIGMAKIEPEKFHEFDFLKYLVIAMILLGLLTSITRKRWMLILHTLWMVGCGVWGAYDFWKWEYQYGHNLDEHAAIKVPGMAYQPPLFGYKQLLNFLASSFPDWGGYLIIGAGFIAVACLIKELFFCKRKYSLKL